MLRKYTKKQWLILLVMILPMFALHVVVMTFEALSDIEYTAQEILFDEVKINPITKLYDKMVYFENYMNLKLGKYFRSDGNA